MADVEAEANANETKLTSGQIFLHQLYSDSGRDLSDDITTAAQAFGVGEEEIRRRLLDITLPDQTQPASGGQTQPTDMAVAAVLNRLNGHKSNGHANGTAVN